MHHDEQGIGIFVCIFVVGVPFAEFYKIPGLNAGSKSRILGDRFIVGKMAGLLFGGTPQQTGQKAEHNEILFHAMNNSFSLM